MKMKSIIIIPKSKKGKVAEKNFIELTMVAEELQSQYCLQNEFVHICRKHLHFNCLSKNENKLITCAPQTLCLVLFAEDKLQNNIVQVFRDLCKDSPSKMKALQDCYICTLNPDDEANFYECLMPYSFALVDCQIKQVMESMPIGSKEREKQIATLLNELDGVSLTAVGFELEKSGHLFEALDKLTAANEKGSLRAKWLLENIACRYFQGKHIVSLK